MLTALLKGIAIGLAAAAPIGQVNVEIARRTLRGGFRAGFAVGVGACTVDVMYAVLTTLGIGTVLARPDVSRVFGFVATAVLAYLGTQCLRAGLRQRPVVVDDGSDPVAVVGPSPRAGYFTGLAMTVVNPMTMAFWFLGLPGMAGPVSRDGLVWVAAGVFAGTISWVITFAGALSLARRFRPGGWMRIADLAGGATLLFFAVWTFLRSIGVVL